MKNDVRVVYNRLLGGYFIVRGPHQTPLGGRFASKVEAEEHLKEQQRRRDSLMRVAKSGAFPGR